MTMKRFVTPVEMRQEYLNKTHEENFDGGKTQIK